MTGPVATGSETAVTLVGFGLGKPRVIDVPLGSSIRTILREAELPEEGFLIGVDGKVTKDLDAVALDGSVLTGAPMVKGATRSPDDVTASPEAIVTAFGLGQISDEATIARAVEEAIASNPRQLEQYRSGKQAIFGYFVGQVMKATGGRANPALLNRLLRERLPGPE